METINLEDILTSSIETGITYKDYRDLTTCLAGTNGTTGLVQSEDLVNYTLLNDKRMKRWDKTIKTPDAIITKMQSINKKMSWIVITESWCGDAAHVMPAINKLAELNDLIEFKVVIRDENEALMNEFLTNGSQSIPKLIIIDTETRKVVNTFGPRPSEATKLVNDYKAKHGKLTPEFKEELQHWYNKNKGQAVLQDIVELI
jgi:thiol-disulfide isomerase/thioredoxin